MSEKVTFRELIESIAEESDNSKQFTHDFLKDFVDVINGGLEQDGNVNIAGFGKFELRRVDEREGYNPQTEEKMTIPAHNKIIFKPYKDVRELVNAPYAHLEPELIEEEDGEQEDNNGTSSTEEDAPQDDFLPTAPPTEHESKEKSEPPKEKHEDPFGFDDAETKSSSSFTLEDEDTSMESEQEDEDDVVEFQGDASAEEEGTANQELSEFIGETESSEDETETENGQTKSDSDTGQETSEEEEITASEEDEQEEPASPYAPNAEQDEDSSAKDTDGDQSEEETAPKAPAFDQNLPSRNRNSSLPLVAAAAGILLLLAAGAWYFGFFSSGESPQMASQEQVTSSEAPQQNNTQQQQNSATDTKNNQQQQSSQQPNQQAKSQSQPQQNVQSDPKTTADEGNTEEHAIAEGQTLWSIAEDKYGNPRLWPWIYGKNGSLNNPNIIIAGKSLDVPLPSGPQNRLNASDSVGVAKGYLATYQWYKNNGSSKAKNHLWGAKLYHNNIRDLADIQIDKADLSYANNAR